MCSNSIPLEPGEVAVTVTAAGATPENSDAGPEHGHPHIADKRTSAAVGRDACLGLRSGQEPSHERQPGAAGVGSAGLLPWSQAGVFDHGPGAGEAGQVDVLGQDGRASQSGQTNAMEQTSSVSCSSSRTSTQAGLSHALASSGVAEVIQQLTRSNAPGR